MLTSSSCMPSVETLGSSSGSSRQSTRLFRTHSPALRTASPMALQSCVYPAFAQGGPDNLEAGTRSRGSRFSRATELVQAVLLKIQDSQNTVYLTMVNSGIASQARDKTFFSRRTSPRARMMSSLCALRLILRSRSSFAGPRLMTPMSDSILHAVANSRLLSGAIDNCNPHPGQYFPHLEAL